MSDIPLTSPHFPVAVDVAIIGGGIAGSALAIALGRQNLDVLLVEREAAFRDRVRGEAIHPWGVREVDTLGLRLHLQKAGAIELPYWTTYRDRVPAEPHAWAADVPDSPPEISVSHPQLQEVLIAAAAKEGVHIARPATATPARDDAGWAIEVTVGDDTRQVNARLLVGADGKNSATRRLIGASTVRDRIHHQFGGMLVSGVDLPRDSAHQGFYEGGFAMAFPQGSDKARIYLAGPNSLQRELLGPGAMPELIRRAAACFPEGALARAEPAGPMAFFPNADIPVDKIADDHAVLIGDAAGANDPTQGHGLSLVFRDVRVLRDLVAEDFETAPQRFAEARRAYYHVLRTHAAWAAPLLTDTGEVADALRAQVRSAREADPAAEGYGNLFSLGPDGLATDDATRRRFYGEHLPAARVRTAAKEPAQGGLTIGRPPE
jgi:2-polyprenyl-6-methoxyphenol hydroxylase-like FAD-dependent oxidoreductase